MQVADLELRAVAGGQTLELADGQAARRLGLEDRSQQQPEEEDKGDGRQHGDHRASEVAIPHPPRSPHFSFRWRTWKYERLGSVIRKTGSGQGSIRTRSRVLSGRPC